VGGAHADRRRRGQHATSWRARAHDRLLEELGVVKDLGRQADTGARPATGQGRADRNRRLGDLGELPGVRPGALPGLLGKYQFNGSTHTTISTADAATMNSLANILDTYNNS
jgi:hypothetical protein